MARTMAPKGSRQRQTGGKHADRDEAQQTFRAFAWNLAAALSEQAKAERQRGGSQR